MKDFWEDIKYIGETVSREFKLITALKITILPLLATFMTFIASKFPKFGVPKNAWWVVGFILAIVILLFVVSRKLRKLENPNIKIDHHSSIEGCRQGTKVNTIDGNVPTIYLRLRVENTGGRVIKNCVAYLVGMEKDGEALNYGERTPLIWSGPKPIEGKIDIQGKADNFLDLVTVGQEWVPALLPIGGDSIYEKPRERKMHARVVTGKDELASVFHLHRFSENGKYTLIVRFSSDEGMSIIKKVVFHWEGDPETMEMFCLENQN